MDVRIRIWDGYGNGVGDGDRMWGYGYGMDLRCLWCESDMKWAMDIGWDMGWDKVVGYGLEQGL